MCWSSSLTGLTMVRQEFDRRFAMLEPLGNDAQREGLYLRHGPCASTLSLGRTLADAAPNLGVQSFDRFPFLQQVNRLVAGEPRLKGLTHLDALLDGERQLGYFVTIHAGLYYVCVSRTRPHQAAAHRITLGCTSKATRMPEGPSCARRTS